VLCDRALLGTFAQNREKVDRATLKQAAHEVFHKPQTRSLLRPLLAGLLLVTTALAVARYQFAGQAPASQLEMPQPKIETEAAVPEPVAEPQPPAEVLEWPQAYPFLRSEEMAYAALFKAWGANYREGDECAQAEAIGLRCLSARGGLDELRQLNLPAVLEMRDGQGQSFHAALVGLDDKAATFAVGEESLAVAPAALATQWDGHYTLLWRKPPLASKKMRPGDYGPDVKWLGMQLAQLAGKADADPGLLYDVALMRQVRQFQSDHGLVVDGTVGPQTMMRLSTLVDETVPKLFREQEAKP